MMQEEMGEGQMHIMQMMLKGRDDAHMSYNENYLRIIGPFSEYILEQMEVRNIGNPIEMAVEMIQQAEHHDNADVLIMNIMAGAMEILDPSQEF